MNFQICLFCKHCIKGRKTQQIGYYCACEDSIMFGHKIKKNGLCQHWELVTKESDLKNYISVFMEG